MSGLSIQPVGNLWLVAGVGLFLFALLFVQARHVRLSVVQTVALIALRVLVVLMTVLAMLRPTLVYTEQKPQQSTLLLLVDASRSMQVEDSLGNKSRWSALQGLLSESADELQMIAEKMDVNVYQFAGEPEPVEIDAGNLSLPGNPLGEQTALGNALEEVLDLTSATRVRGVIVLSDGAERAIPPLDVPPHQSARRLADEGIPLYTCTFGTPGGSSRADLRIDDLLASSTVFAQAPTEVHANLTARGYANQSVHVQLLWEDSNGEMEVVDTVTHDIGLDDEPIPMTLRYIPQTPGEYKITVRAEPQDGELVTSNNGASTFITVREGGINVLYLVGATRIGGSPGVEQRYARAALAESPDIVLQRKVFDYRRQEKNIMDLLKPGELDVIVLDDVDSQAMSQDNWQQLTDFISSGAGLMVLGGYHSYGPGGYRELPIADVLPIEIGFAERQNFGENLRQDIHLEGPLQMKPAAPLGLRHPIMQLGGQDSVAIWEELPALDGANLFDRQKVKPGAMLLAESDKGAPLLVAAQPGSGRMLAFAGDSTWRWSMKGFADAHRRFWRQSILWLAKKDDDVMSDVWVKLGVRRVRRGGPIDFQFGANDEQLEPIENAQFTVEVETLDGKRLPVRTRDKSGQGIARFRETAKPGDYMIHVSATAGEEELGNAQARFLVPDQDLELDRPAADPGLLAQLAEFTKESGGHSLAPEELPGLLEQLAEEPQEYTEEILAKVTYWDTWPFLLVFVGLLTGEWYLRKRWGLV